jgi:hypothetical protein
MKFPQNLLKLLYKYKYILAFVALLILIAFVNIPVIKEGLTGMSQYAYLAPLPKNYMEITGIDDAYLTKFFTKWVNNILPDSPYKDQSINYEIINYKSNPDTYKEEMDFYLANGYFPWNSYNETRAKEFFDKNTSTMNTSERLKHLKIILSNRKSMTSGFIPFPDKESEAYKIYMGIIPEPSSNTKTTSLIPSSDSLSGTGITSKKEVVNSSYDNSVTLQDFMDLCKRATS